MKTALSLAGGFLSALGGSACCALPLLLVSLGFGGAWTLRIQRLAAYQPYFMAVSAVFLGFAFQRLYIRPRVCTPGEACASPRTLRNQRIAFWVVVALAIAMFAFLE